MADISLGEIVIAALSSSGLVAVGVTKLLNDRSERLRVKREFDNKREEQGLEEVRQKNALELDNTRQENALEQVRKVAEQTVSTEVLKFGLENLKTLQNRDQINSQREANWLQQINLLNLGMNDLRKQIDELRQDNVSKDSVITQQAVRISFLEGENTQLREKVLQLETTVHQLQGVA